MDRSEVAKQMAEQLRNQGNVYMNEVALPGVRPTEVKDEEIDQFKEEI